MASISNQKGRGFTIIEVMIVLTIAGLILLIVFLAVPALQRNSRNTQRRKDVGHYLAAVREWSANHLNAIPSANVDLTASDGVNALVKLSYYSPPTSAGSGADVASLDTDTLRYVARAECDPSGNGKTHTGSSYQIAIRYSLESGGSSPLPQCQNS